MKILPLKLDVEAMKTKLLQQSEETRFATLKQLILLRVQGFLVVSDLIQIAKDIKPFSKLFILQKINNCVTDDALLFVSLIFKEMHQLGINSMRFELMREASNKQLEKIYNKQFN